MADMVIAELYTYPIKSCGTLSHTEIALDARGVLYVAESGQHRVLKLRTP